MFTYIYIYIKSPLPQILLNELREFIKITPQVSHRCDTSLFPRPSAKFPEINFSPFPLIQLKSSFTIITNGNSSVARIKSRNQQNFFVLFILFFFFSSNKGKAICAETFQLVSSNVLFKVAWLFWLGCSWAWCSSSRARPRRRSPISTRPSSSTPTMSKPSSTRPSSCRSSAGRNWGRWRGNDSSNFSAR